MRFLEQRDLDFDTVKSFLIISMIFAHGFQKMWISHYNRNLTYYVMFGFIFLSGLTVGSVYHEKLLARPIKYSWAIVSRGLKLLCIFILANVFIILLSKYRLMHLLSMQPSELLFAVLSGERGSDAKFIIVSFVILVSISLTFVGSPLLLSWRRSFLDWAFLGFGVGALWVIEKTGRLDYYAVKMTIIGLIGAVLAKLLTSANWTGIRATSSRWVFEVLACYIGYQAALLAFNEGADILARHYVNVTALLLLVVYLSSYRLGLTCFAIVKLLNRSLAKHMLFAYLFHILFLVILSEFISRGNFCFATAICLLTLAVTTLGGLSVDALSRKYKSINGLYSLVFR